MDETLAHLLKLHISSSQLSYARLADRSGLDVAYIHRLATGVKNKPRRDVAIRLGVALRLAIPRIDELLLAAGHPPLTPQLSASASRSCQTFSDSAQPG